MELPSKRAKLIRTGCVAHLIGLTVVGFYGTVGTSGGFGNGAWAGMLVGFIISVPWFAALVAVIWFFSDFYWKHTVSMCIVGPAAVCGSWWLVDKTDLIYAVALTAITASISFLNIISFVRWREAAAT